MSIIAKANNHFKLGEYGEAVGLYAQAMRMHPEMAQSLKLNIEIAKSRDQHEGTAKKQYVTVHREVNASELSKSIFVGIAAIPDREYALKLVVASLINQVDRIGVYLNGWDKVPEFLIHEKIIVAGMGAEDLGDVGKFYWVNDHDGIYFSCDDDLIYPPDYIDRMVSRLEYYRYMAAVGWHGSLLKEPFVDYYKPHSRRVFVFSAHRPHDTPVHILGTGCCAFHTKIFPVKLEDFPTPNMADIYFSIKGQNLQMPFYVVKHEKDEIKEVEGAKESSIYSHSNNKIESKKNTINLQNKYVSEHPFWVTYEHRPLSILLVGRFENYSKGGIYKSCKLIESELKKLGHRVTVLDTQNDLIISSDDKFDLCWIYPGDPARPDFESVDRKISILQEANVPVLVNLSYLYEPRRNDLIAQKIKKYNAKFGSSPVLAAVFTESAANDPGLVEVRNYICVVPKTLLPTPSRQLLSFSSREGICLGDATKLSNEVIIGGSINPWIEAISRRLPNVNLYAYKQYAGKNPHPKIQYVPHMSEDFGDWLGRRRLFICANVHLTFEMVACEAQSYGTPVVYRHMPHSLSEYISATGFAVRSPNEMGEMVAWLYNDKHAWDNISKSSIFNSNSKHVDLLSSSLVGYLRLAIFRAKELGKVMGC